MSAESQELSRLSIREVQTAFDDRQKKAIVDVLGVKHATESDLDVFFHQARRTGLDPFLRQLYMIARKTGWDPQAQREVYTQTFQTGIDGFRVIAHRRAKQLNKTLTYDDPVYFDGEGKPHDVWVKEGPPAAVRVVVHMGDARYPFTARYEDFVPLIDEYEDVLDAEGKPVMEGKKKKRQKTGRKIPSGMWATRPTGQLEKCAEASALRRACPQDLSGIYEFTEMERDEPAVTTLIESRTVESPAKPSGRDWIGEVRDVMDTDTLRALYEECDRAGERTVTFTEAVSYRLAELRAAQPPVDTETGEVSEGAEEPAAGDEPAGDTEVPTEAQAATGDDMAAIQDQLKGDPWSTAAPEDGS